MDVVTANHPFLLSEMGSMKHFYRLASESEISSSDESVSSAQMQMTASCQDTPDTSSTEESDVEFSVLTSSDSVSAQPEVSSGPEDVFEAFPIAPSTEPKRCVKCHIKCSPFPYCRRCYRDRKRFLPPRPISRKEKKKLHKDRTVGAGESSKTEEIKSSACASCFSAPANAVFIHGEIGHQIFCYPCSYRVWQERQTCPYCNRSITKVVKIFRADFE